MDKSNLIKINLPSSPEEYNKGNGEGVWVFIDDVTKIVYDRDDYTTGSFTAIVGNDSFYWDGLECGQIVPIEMRGDHRPVVSYDWLFANFGSY